MAGLALALLAGCNGDTRHKVLSVVFDGVPAPRPAGEATDTAASGATEAQQGSPRVVGSEHGPYAARQCQGCHVGGASNALVVPADQLCGRCHELQLTKRYVHGPLASGGCLVCHDPHSSSFQHLLVADSATFCLHCHDRASLGPTPEHQSVTAQCTDCHDAHQSDRKYLLK